MSDLYRLRELAALFKPRAEPEPVVEATAKANSDFEGIKRVVDDALGDLHDKLGEGGALETLLDKAGLTDLDKNKDSDGATMLERLSVRTAQFAKEVEKLMTEVELMIASDTMSEELTEGKNTDQMRANYGSLFSLHPSAKGPAKSAKVSQGSVKKIRAKSYGAAEAMVIDEYKGAEIGHDKQGWYVEVNDEKPSDPSVKTTIKGVAKKVSENENSALAGMKSSPGAKRAGLAQSKKDPNADHENDGGKIEAHGVRGMKNTAWRKTFKNRAALDAWVDKMDGEVEIYGTRDAD